MKLNGFKEKKNKKKIIIGSATIIVLLLTLTVLIRTFAIYKEANEFSVIKGMVPDQFYDTMFAFYQMDESGNKTPINTIPAGKNWDVSVTWNTGKNETSDYNTASKGLVNHFYNYERSNNNGKICTSGIECNDTVTRTTT